MGIVYLAALCAILASVEVPAMRRPAFEAIERDYKRLEQAFGEADTTTILGLRDAAFVVRFPSGAVGDFATMAADMRLFFEVNLPPIKAKYEIKKALFLAPDSALIVSTGRISRYQNLGGKRRKIEHETTQNDLWVQRADGWRMRSVDFIRNQRRWVDGKQVDPTKPYDPKAPEYKPPKSSFETP